MKQNGMSLGFDISQVCPNFCLATVTIPAEIVDSAYDIAIKTQAKNIKPRGFHHDVVSYEYVRQNFEKNTIIHLEEFLLKHFVLNFLHTKIFDHKINIAGDPRISEVIIKNGQDAKFIFEISLFDQIEFQNWKYYAFKAPQRKNYKDLDRQAMDFIKEEKIQKYNSEKILKVNDWINLDIWLVDEEKKPVFGNHKENLWLKIGNEEADIETQKIFLSKKIGDLFYTESETIQEYYGSTIGSNYTFGIKVRDILNNDLFCFEQFKKQFRLKTKKEVLNQLIEIFSYRNDISQRQATVEEAFKLMFSKYNVNIPKHILLRHQKKLLSEIQKNPDYHVYKSQENFEDNIKKLAEKQIKEIIFIDQLAKKEKIKISHEDVTNYLNLTKRARTKDFIYFKLPDTTVDCLEIPVSSHVIWQQALREKAINFVIYNFTKK